MIEEGKLTCHVKLGGYYLKQIKDFADMSFGEAFMYAKLNRKESCFEIWVKHDVEKKAKKKFEDKFKQCKIRVFEEKEEAKK